MPILATKLYIPPPRTKVVLRPRLNARLNEGLQRKLTLVSAPAGFGKSTLVGEWCNLQRAQIAWLSLDIGDSDPKRFLTYLIAAVQTVAAHSGLTIGQGLLSVLQAPQPPSVEMILTILVNEITTIPDDFVLVLDDYHVIDSAVIDEALGFLLENLPPQMHLVIATREDPRLPLARLRVREQLTEVRAADLRFTQSEAVEFLNKGMGLRLAVRDIAALEARTEGWIAGLQLAALSMQGQHDVAGFIKSFTGSHHFVMDYLVQEVLQHQPENIQDFLLRTSILDRLCGPLCDAILGAPAGLGQEMLDSLLRANLFVIPLDNERRWYRYHHLFADLLRQRLPKWLGVAVPQEGGGVAALHIRASEWYEQNDLDVEAFQHAAAANDIERATRLLEGRGIPLHFRGAVMAVLAWLEALPVSVLNARPMLWWNHAALMLVNGHTVGVDDKLDAAEAALQEVAPDDKTRNLVGQIAVARATLALTRYQVDTMIVQSHRALEYLHPGNGAYRANAYWTLGFANLMRGERAAAGRAYQESIALSRQAGDTFTTILATIGWGNVQEFENRLYAAAQTFRQVLEMAGDQPLQIVSEAHMGLARVFYEWNDLDTAEEHGRQSLHLARQFESVIDRYIISEVFLARLKLVRGDAAGAVELLAQSSQSAQERNFVLRLPEVAAAQALTLLWQGNIAAAAHLAQTHNLPLTQARVYLAQGDASAALAVLDPVRQQAESMNWTDERLRVMVLQAVALGAQDETESAVQLLSKALALAEPEGLVRTFADEGAPMAALLSAAAAQGVMPDYTAKLLAVMQAEQVSQTNALLSRTQPLVEPLSQRELKILELVAQGLSNQEIGERLFLALSTVKGHIQSIFGKLQVQRRTEAVARARELGLL